MKRVLLFDTETTGLVDYKRPLNDARQPRLVQLAYILATEDGRIIEERNMLFSPLLFPEEQYKIPQDAFNVHGIDTEFAVDNGWQQNYAPVIFNNIIKKADVLVAHNIKYDISIMKTAYSRFMPKEDLDYLSSKDIYCTMNGSINLVKMPPTRSMLMYGKKGYKNPSLADAYKHFFNEKIEGAHDAMVDVKACSRIFFHIKKLEREKEHTNTSTLEF